MSEASERRGSLRDAELAVRNGFKLGGALAVTWTVGLTARILLPRFLGPESFGAINFSDAFAATAFVLVGLGLDTHIRKEVAIRWQHATEIFWGTLLLRLGLSALVFAATALVLHVTDRPPDVRRIVYLFGGAQVCISVNGSLSAMLHARGRVDGLAVVSVVSKVAWGVAILAGFLLRNPVLGVPLALLVTELGKTLALTHLARSHLGLRFRLDGSASRAAVVASLPFFLHLVATTTYARADVSLLAFLVQDEREIGWYGAAATLARVALLMAPLMTWILMPLFSRAAARSEEELRRAMARSTEALLVVAMPVALLLGLGADLWVELIFGAAYAPASLALRILAPVFVLSYVSAVCSIALNSLGRGWAVTAVAVIGMIGVPVLDLVLIPRAAAWGHGAGSAGAACALAALLVELVLTSILVAILRGRLFDRRSTSRTGRTLAACVLVTILHLLWAGTGPARLAVDLVGYGALAALLRLVPLREMIRFVRSSLRSSDESPLTAAAPSSR